MLSTAGIASTVVVEDVRSLRVPPVARTWDATQSALKSIGSPDLDLLLECCALDRLNVMVDPLADSMKTRLQNPDAPSMLPTCVSTLPTGTESGAYLAVDLGGSTVKVAFIKLEGNSVAKVLYKTSHPVSAEIKGLSGQGFFKWIASKIKAAVDYAIEHGYLVGDYHALVTGLSWSFPFRQTSVERGFIAAMGKGYTVTDEILGWDLKDAFEKAAAAVGVRIEVSAVVNDTAASLIAHAYASPRTRLGLILGTGLNACAMFPVATIGTKADGLNLRNGTNSLVNTELSMFGTGIVPETKWDREIDVDNERPGYQPLECKVSGRYLGEIVRLILRDLAAAGHVFGGVAPEAFKIRFGLESSLVAEIEQLISEGRYDLAQHAFLQSHTVESITDSDLQLMYDVIVAVSTRAAALTALGLVSLATLLPADCVDSVIAYNGTVIEKYPRFRERCQKYLNDLGLPRLRKLSLEPAGDGSLLGPAIASSMIAGSS